MEVIATAAAFYNGSRVRRGDKVVLKNKEDHNPRWMTPPAEPSPEKPSLPKSEDIDALSFKDLGEIIEAYGIEGASRSEDDRRKTVEAYVGKINGGD
jgi:hypothetical protein